MSISEEIAESSARGGFYLFAGGALSTGIAALASILIGRLLGPDNYGLYSLSLTPSSFLLIASGFGINIALVKYLSEFEREGKYNLIKRYIAIGLSTQLAIGVGLAVLLIYFSDLFALYLINRPEASIYIKITAIYIVGVVVFRVINQSLIGLNRMDRSSLVTLLQSISKFTIAIGLIILGYGVFGAVSGHSISYLIAGLIGLAILYIMTRGKKDGNDVNPSGVEVLSGMIRYGFPVYLSTILTTGIGIYRNYLMALYASNTEIGNFTAAFNLSTSIAIFIAPIATVLFPAFSKLRLDEEANIARGLFKRAVKYSTMVILPITIFVIVSSKEFTYTFYGSSYILAPEYLELASLRYVIVGLGSVVLMSFFNGIGDTGKVFRMGVITAVSALILYPILILTLHMTGLIIGIVISLALPIIYGLYKAYKEYNVSIEFNSILRIYVAGIFAGLITYAIKYYIELGRPIYELVTYGLIYLIIYLIILPYLRGITLDDIEILDKSFRNIKVVGLITHMLLTIERRLIEGVRK